MMKTIPVTLLAGYLGSGKTTLVNHVLRHANGLRIAVMVNDFGDLPIDASLIETEDDDVIQLSGGCVCCSYGNDLVRALARLKELAVLPEHVLIECSGVALPLPVKRSLTLIPGLQYDGTVGLVDGFQFQKQIVDRYIGDTVQRQIEQADMLFVNKTDLIDQSELDRVTQKISEITNAKIAAVKSARVPVGAILSSGIPVNEACHVTAEKFEESEFSHAHFHALVARGQALLNIEKLRAELTAPNSNILRAKGYVNADDGQRYLLQLVGQTCEFTQANTPSAEYGLANSESLFVLIGVAEQMTLPSFQNLDIYSST